MCTVLGIALPAALHLYNPPPPGLASSSLASHTLIPSQNELDAQALMASSRSGFRTAKPPDHRGRGAWKIADTARDAIQLHAQDTGAHIC